MGGAQLSVNEWSSASWRVGCYFTKCGWPYQMPSQVQELAHVPIQNLIPLYYYSYHSKSLVSQCNYVSFFRLSAVDAFQYMTNCTKMIELSRNATVKLISMSVSPVSSSVVKMRAPVPSQFITEVMSDSWPVVLFVKVVTTWESWREGGREGEREREGGKEKGREKGRERGRVGSRKGGRKGGRKKGRERGTEGRGEGERDEGREGGGMVHGKEEGGSG